MRRLSRFRRLSPDDRRLLLRALLVVAAIRSALWILPFGLVRRASARTRLSPGPGNAVDQIAWAVRGVSRYLPSATCLTQALSAQALLGFAGHSSRVEIGVAKDEVGKFAAHAWVICGERVVIGGPETARYAPLIAWEGGCL